MKKIRILWSDGVHDGTVTASYAELDNPAGQFSGAEWDVSFKNAAVDIGGFQTIVNIRTGRNPFSFYLRDVNAVNPIYLPACSAVVTTADDRREYGQIVADICEKGAKSKQALVEADSEYSYCRAAVETRDLPGPAWLGISKDMRYFEVTLRTKAGGNDTNTYDSVMPKFHCRKPGDKLPPEMGERDTKYHMMAGRGLGCRHQVTKRLEDGYMPILNAQNEDDGIIYDMTYFTTLEKSPLDAAHIRGTDMYAADACGAGCMFTPESQKRVDAVIDGEIFREEETVMYIRVVAENTIDAPKYCFIYSPNPVPGREYDKKSPKINFDPKTGFTSFETSGRICVISSVDGKPLMQEEISVLLAPHEKITFVFKIPHQPISTERAAALADVSFDVKLAEAKKFWQSELAGAAQISLPEKRIEEMIKAGLLHMDVGYFGKNPDGPVVPIVGVYTAIGSESSPGIQFLDAVGEHEFARRAIQYFVEKQHESGFMQNFGGYMLETGSALWTMGEHYRMTLDEQWAASVRDCVVKAAEYLIGWRAENLGDELKGGKGYGMIKGKIADPEDHFHSFMLNAGAYAGMARAGEILINCDPVNAKKFADIAAEMRCNIRESFLYSMAVSPAMPSSDGTWYRPAAPWTEYPGPVSLYSEGGTWYSHATSSCRDFINSSYLFIQGVVDTDEPIADEILKYYTEFLTINNTAFSQSYYSPHPYAQLMRGEVQMFLQEFYSGFAALADRESYSFWEHYHHASPHKLHEETWFLMRCRWMLVLENYESGELKLMAGTPRKWYEDGKVIDVSGMKTYFGPVSYKMESYVGMNRIKVRINAGNSRFPQIKTLTVHLPHSDGIKAKYTTAGEYCADSESVFIHDFSGFTDFELVF